MLVSVHCLDNSFNYLYNEPKIIVLGAIEPEIQAFYSRWSSRFGQNSTTRILRPGMTKEKKNLNLF